MLVFIDDVKSLLRLRTLLTYYHDQFYLNNTFYLFLKSNIEKYLYELNQLYFDHRIQDMNLDTSFLSLSISHKLHVIYAWVVGDGELYTWGSNENGCLGIGCTDVIHSPERVEDPFLKSSVSKVSCGWKHTAAVSEGKLFTWGWGGSHGTFSEEGHSSGGQLGHGDDVDYIEPNMVNFGRDVKVLEISCGFNHTGTILEYT